MKKMSVREAYGRSLAEYGFDNKDVVVLVADVSSSMLTSYFADRFPTRFFNTGITEQSLVDVAVGFALGGLVPFANTFAVLFLRAFEQIRTCVAYADTNVKLVGGYSGLSNFKDGPTHHSDVDIAIMRSLPNMSVVEPADAIEVEKFVPVVAEYAGPVYLRLSRSDLPQIFDENHNVNIGTGLIVSEGCDVSLIACGSMVSRCLEASKELSKMNINARVLNIHTIKPLDNSLIKKAAEETGAIVTAEEHSIIGGLGSAVSEIIGEEYHVPMKRLGIRDVFTETAMTHEDLLDSYGMSVKDIVDSAKMVIKIK